VVCPQWLPTVAPVSIFFPSAGLPTPSNLHNLAWLLLAALTARHSPAPPSPVNPGNYPGNHPRSCTARDGIIEVISASDHSTLGYIKGAHSGDGKYGLCSDPKDALPVHANCDNDWFDVPIIVRNTLCFATHACFVDVYL
jgi:hypothetical protein